MADHVKEIVPAAATLAVEDQDRESILDKISEKLHHDSSSSPLYDSEDEKEKKKNKVEKVSAVEEDKKAKTFRIFGLEKPVHHALDGGKQTSVVQRAVASTNRKTTVRFQDLKQRRYKVPLMIGIFLLVLQQAIGVNGILFYAGSILKLQAHTIR